MNEHAALDPKRLSEKFADHIVQANFQLRPFGLSPTAALDSKRLSAEFEDHSFLEDAIS